MNMAAATSEATSQMHVLVLIAMEAEAAPLLQRLKLEEVCDPCHARIHMHSHALHPA